MKFRFLNIVLGVLLVGFMAGCSSDSDSDGSAGVKVGFLIDSPIAGITYECDSKSGITDSSGRFECENPPVVFKIGLLVIGTLDSLTIDSKVYPQDLLGISRSNFNDVELIALTRLLQSLDDDGDYALVINIPKSTSDKFNINEVFDSSKLDEYIATAGVVLVGEDEAINHLKANMPDNGDEDAVPDEDAIPNGKVITILSNMNADFAARRKGTYISGGFKFEYTERKGCSDRGYTTVTETTYGVVTSINPAGDACVQRDYSGIEGATGPLYILIY